MRSQVVSGVRGRDEAGMAGPPSPEIVELTGAGANLGPGRSVTWLVCGTVMLGMVVVFGLVEWRPASGREDTERGTRPSRAAHDPLIPGSIDAHPAAPGLGAMPGSTPQRHQRIVILLPAPGEVILGTMVPVAGRVASPGPPRGVVLTVVHVAIVAEGTTLGVADLPIVGGRFAGWVEVVAPVRGQVVVIRAWDAQRPGMGSSIQEFVLRAATDVGSSSPWRPVNRRSRSS